MYTLKVLILVLFVAFSIASDEQSSSYFLSSESPADLSKLDSRKKKQPEFMSDAESSLRPAKRKKKSRYQSVQIRIDRRTAKLLTKPDSGFDDYETARKAAEDTIVKERERSRQSMQKYRRLNPGRANGCKKPPGYRTKAAIIERKSRLISKVDQTLTDKQVRVMAEEQYRVYLAKNRANTKKSK